jgi:hypothetical protein
LSQGFAANLWPTTKLGVRVIVARNDPAPTEFDHPKLFVPKPKPAVSPEVMSEPARNGLVQVAQSTTPATDARALGAAPSAPEAVKPTPTEVDPPKPAAPGGRLATPPVKPAGHVAVFVSRKEKKIFVRQGFVPLFDMPVVIDEPDRPLGTHVYTAMGSRPDGSGMRWTLISLSPDMRKAADNLRSRKKKGEQVKPVVVETRASSTAAEALDRIQMPAEAFDRIGELMAPGTSLVVSDQGISGETGRGTDFIVLTR